jgi:hypothetical protein
VAARIVAGNIPGPGEAAAKVIVAKAITSAPAVITAVAGNCAAGASENKKNCENDGAIAQH